MRPECDCPNWNFFCCPLTLLSLYPVGCLSSAFLNWDSQQGRKLATSGRSNKNKISIGPILFLYYEESLVSSNLNSKQLRFHGAHPKLKVPFCDFIQNLSQALSIAYPCGWKWINGIISKIPHRNSKILCVLGF